MSLGAIDVARPKQGSKKTVDGPQSGDERVAIIHLKGTPSYAAWLDDVYKETHIPKTSMFRLALKEWAERKGLPAPPEL